MTGPATWPPLRASTADISAHGLGDRVAVLGAVPPERIIELCVASDVFVLASRFEGYGMALAEAIAHGLPVVSTMAGAIPDTVPGGHRLAGAAERCGRVGAGAAPPDHRSRRTTAARHEH